MQTIKKNESSDIVKVDNIAMVKDSLKIKAIQLEETYSKNNYLEFFKLFPNTFDEFLKLYGYDDEKGKMPLYDVYEKHINFFFRSYELNKEYFIPKIFNLAKGGHWEADATGILRDNIIEFIKLHTKEVVSFLDRKPHREIKGFWHFVLDGRGNSYLREDMFETIYGKINALDKKQGILLKEEFENMYD